MQLSAINSQNFKGYANDIDINKFSADELKEIEEAEKMLEVLKTAEDKFVYSKEQSDKKSKAGTLVSLALGAAVLFSIGKKGYNKAHDIVSYITGNEKVQNISKAALARISELAKKDNKLMSILQNASKRISQAGSLVNEKIISKAGGAGNIVGGATAVAGTYVVAGTDSDKNGIADIAEKGVNAYKGAIQNLGIVREVIEALS